MSAFRKVCVCVPARDEGERLPRLVDALAAQDWPGVLPVVVALNNTTDGSRDILAALARRHSGRLELHVDEVVFPAEEAHAGSARRRAMDAGVAIVGRDDGAVLLTTDADARPPSHWVTANLAAIDRGADLVGGALVLDENEPIPETMRARWTALSAYWREVRRIEDEIDPVSWDPPIRHGDHTGGSLAVAVAAYRAAGGIPAIPVGEDAAFVIAARRTGFRLAHPNDVWTRVSPRMEARAAGGMAATMAALARSDQTGMAVPSLHQWADRARWRRSVRIAPGGGDARVAELEQTLPPMVCDVTVAPVIAADAA